MLCLPPIATVLAAGMVIALVFLLFGPRTHRGREGPLRDRDSRRGGDGAVLLVLESLRLQLVSEQRSRGIVEPHASRAAAAREFCFRQRSIVSRLILRRRIAFHARIVVLRTRTARPHDAVFPRIVVAHSYGNIDTSPGCFSVSNALSASRTMSRLSCG